jgi:site-specific DNA-adenine methylase
MARHYGIPYMGSKQKLVDKIVPFILKRHPDATDFYDLFGGGGSVALYAVLKHPELAVHYNELSTAIGGLMKHLQDTGELSLDWIDRAEFNKLKDGGDWRAGLMQTVWSFGNKTDATYLYGRNIQDFKHEMHKAVVDGANNFGTIERMAHEILARDYQKDQPFHVFISPKYKTPYQRRIVLMRQVPLIGAMQHLGRIERLQQIQNMPGLSTLDITFGTGYDAVAIKGDRPIIYCDPPYEGTTGYAEGGFDSRAFYDWVAAQEHPVYFSSYGIKDDRFKLIRAVKTRSLLDQKTRDSYHFNYENLYWNGKN